ncbi:MAG: hypothetical protein AAF382_10270 [Pseudomonadota bacterium]
MTNDPLNNKTPTKASEKRRLVIHAGPHKTATTYVQENLFAARDALARAGWLYPVDPIDNRTGQHGLTLHAEEYLLEDGARRQILEDWARSARQENQNILLSAESFCRWEAKNLDWLADILGFDDYEIIYVIRDALDLFPSLWGEEVKHGRTAGFADRFARICLQPLQSRILNPMLDVKPWLKNDQVRVHAVPFDLLKTRGADIYCHITESILHVHGLTPTAKGVINPKIALEVTEFLRLITLMHHDGQSHCGPELRIKFTEFLTPELSDQIKTEMLGDARHARRNIPVRANQGFQKTIEANLKRHLADLWSAEVRPDEPMFSYERRVFPYYNEFILSTVEPVRLMAEGILQQING